MHWKKVSSLARAYPGFNNVKWLVVFLLALYSTVAVAVAIAVAVAVAVPGIPPVLDCEYSRYSCKRTPL